MCRKTGTDNSGNALNRFAVNFGVHQRNTGNEAKNKRYGHNRQKRMNLVLGDSDNHDDDSDNKRYH